MNECSDFIRRRDVSSAAHWHFHRVLLEAKGVKVYKCRCQRAFVQILEQDEETAGETTIFDYMKGAIPKFLQNLM